MKGKYVILLGSFLFAQTQCIAGSSPESRSADNDMKSKFHSSIEATRKDLAAVDAEIDKVLKEARELQEENKKYATEADVVEDKDPSKAKQLEELEEKNEKKLRDLLDKLEELLAKQAFIKEQLGDPNNEGQSPYQP